MINYNQSLKIDFDGGNFVIIDNNVTYNLNKNIKFNIIGQQRRKC